MCNFFVFTTFWCHLWSITEQVHSNVNINYGILYLLNTPDSDAQLHFKSESVCSFAVFCTALYIRKFCIKQNQPNQRHVKRESSTTYEAY